MRVYYKKIKDLKDFYVLRTNLNNQMLTLKATLTIVNRLFPSIILSIGNVNSRNNSRRRRNEDTVSSKRPLPSCNLEQSKSITWGF